MRKISQVYDIESPNQIKDMSIDELTLLCQDIRSFLIESISKTGGHLSSNLGIVEVTVAMHYVFDSPKDKMIFDVGHQCYTHKILTGRSTQFATLRKKGGLSGYQGRNHPRDARSGAAGVHRGPHCGYGTGYCRQDRKIFR
mgnify:CR=1 FL=1